MPSPRSIAPAARLFAEPVLAADEVHDRRRNELARSQQAARVAEHAQLQREAQLVARAPARLDVLQAQELDRPLRAVHLSGNWGHTADAVELWEMDRTQRLVPLRYVEYLRSVQVDWVGFSVALHLEHSMDSTLERTYSGVRVPTFSDDAVRQIIREFREHGFNVYMTLAIESFETEDELDAVKHPAPRFQLGDPGYADTGIPDDHLYCTCARQIDPDFWPWRPSHPDHDLFVAEFWESYALQSLHFATIAEEEGVRMYSLGTETDRLFRTRPGGDYWINHFGTELQSMVDRVRAVYSGLLTYDMHYGAYWRDWFTPGSWRLWEDLDLDVIGVSSWFPLVDEPPTTVMDVASLRREYERIFKDHLIPMAERNPGRPLVFLEYAAVQLVPRVRRYKRERPRRRPGGSGQHVQGAVRDHGGVPRLGARRGHLDRRQRGALGITLGPSRLLLPREAVRTDRPEVARPVADDHVASVVDRWDFGMTPGGDSCEHGTPFSSVSSAFSDSWSPAATTIQPLQPLQRARRRRPRHKS